MNLDPRLSLAFDLYDDCSLAADIGTDHAHLPIALLKSGKCRRMILTDISPDALRNAQDNIGKARLGDRVDFRLGDGLGAVSEPCGMISVLGMGGRTIQQILMDQPSSLQGANLLLSAHTDLHLVRQAVMEIGYHLISETPVFDTGRYYLILKAVPGKEKISPREIQYGVKLFESDSPALQPFLAHRIEVLEAKLNGLQKASVPDEKLIAELQSDIRFLQSHLR